VKKSDQATADGDGHVAADAAEHEHTFDELPQATAVEVVDRDESGRVGSAGARALARRRWERYYAALEEGAGAAVGGTADDALRQIARVTTARAVDSEDAKQLQAAHMMMSRLMGEGMPEASQPDRVTLTASLPVDAIPDLAAALREARRMRSQDNAPD